MFPYKYSRLVLTIPSTATPFSFRLCLQYTQYRNDATGRLAYASAILLKILLFAYSKGITFSREMQWSCETNIIFNAFSCDSVLHITTLASFVSRHADEIEALFEQVLLVQPMVRALRSVG
ncbi:transposase [Vreelandella zhaodongensis]|uniref:transposase n=1 Tax=Vreelandella zhaodongensis TaxID=1176240 RepID=UPI003EBB8342